MDLLVVLWGTVMATLICWGLKQTHGKVARVERQLVLLVKHAKIDVEKICLEEATALLRRGKKPEAIALVRDYCGIGLVEAMKKVDTIVASDAGVPK